eukprot:XP_795779.2 PREDICTED: uncharacterized protein LOC591105 [Strongylocentrotus purpuratus]
MLAVCLLTFIAMSIAAVPATTPTTTPQPPNGIPKCAIYECPVYTTLEEIGSDMWKRRIEQSAWVHKVAPTCDRTEAIGLVVGDLDAYLEDNNMIESTPIFLRVEKNKPGQNSSCTGQSGSFPCCDQIYELFRFIPEASQETAPIPSQDSGIQLLHLDAFELYGITFLGPNHNEVEQYEKLRKYLDEQGILYYGNLYDVAVYDKPTDPQPHRNEVVITVI